MTQIAALTKIPHHKHDWAALACQLAKFHRTPTARLHLPRHGRVHRGLDLTQHHNILHHNPPGLGGKQKVWSKGQTSFQIHDADLHFISWPFSTPFSLHCPNMLQPLSTSSQALHPLSLFIIDKALAAAEQLKAYKINVALFKSQCRYQFYGNRMKMFRSFGLLSHPCIICVWPCHNVDVLKLKCEEIFSYSKLLNRSNNNI